MDGNRLCVTASCARNGAQLVAHQAGRLVKAVYPDQPHRVATLLDSTAKHTHICRIHRASLPIGCFSIWPCARACGRRPANAVECAVGVHVYVWSNVLCYGVGVAMRLRLSVLQHRPTKCRHWPVSARPPSRDTRRRQRQTRLRTHYAPLQTGQYWANMGDRKRKRDLLDATSPVGERRACAVGDKTRGWYTLPAEIAVQIVECLRRLRDVAACVNTSKTIFNRAWLHQAVLRTLARGALDVDMIMSLGAPLSIVHCVFQKCPDLFICSMHLPAAARGGRLDVLRWVSNQLVPQPSSSSSSLSALPLHPPSEALPAAVSFIWKHPPTSNAKHRAAATPIVARKVKTVHLTQLEFSLEPNSPYRRLRDHVADIGVKSAAECYHHTLTKSALFWVPVRFADGRVRDLDDAHRVVHDIKQRFQALEWVYSCALMAATMGGHVDTLRYLLKLALVAEGEVRHYDLRNGTGLQAVAASHGHVDMVAFWHDIAIEVSQKQRLRGNRTCTCNRTVALVAADSCQMGVLDWMINAQCAAMRGCANKLIVRAIKNRNVTMIRWLAQTTQSLASPPSSFLSANVRSKMDEAVERLIRDTRVDVLAALQESGLWRCQLKHTVTATRLGKLPIVKWIRTIKASPLDGVAPPWNPHVVGRVAAESDNVAVIQWMLGIEDCRRALNDSTAHVALLRGNVDIVNVLVGSGITRLSSWDALFAAVQTCSSDLVKKIVNDDSVAYSQTAMEWAIKNDLLAITKHICKRHGFNDIQSIVDTLTTTNCTHVVMWLREQLPDLCVAGPQSALLASGYWKDRDKQYPLGSPCACAARCRVRYMTEFMWTLPSPSSSHQ